MAILNGDTKLPDLNSRLPSSFGLIVFPISAIFPGNVFEEPRRRVESTRKLSIFPPYRPYRLHRVIARPYANIRRIDSKEDVAPSYLFYSSGRFIDTSNSLNSNLRHGGGKANIDNRYLLLDFRRNDENAHLYRSAYIRETIERRLAILEGRNRDVT